jgi:hypothetical protein
LTSSQGAAVDGGEHCDFNQNGHRFSSIVFPNQTAADFSSPSCCRCILDFLKHVRHYKDNLFFFIVIFWIHVCRTYILQVF